MITLTTSYPTKLITLPGTIITLFGVLPSNCLIVLSSAITISCICGTVQSKGNLMVKRIFPLKETGYSFSDSTKYFSSQTGKATVEIEPS